MELKVGYKYLVNTFNYPLITEIEILNISSDDHYFCYKAWGTYEQYWREIEDFKVLSCLGKVEVEEKQGRK